MQINKLIVDTLKPLSIPVSFQKYTGEASTYITFHKYNENGIAYENDEEVLIGHYIQIDLWSKEDYSNLVNSIKNLLLQANFKRLDEADLYEKDTGLYHKGMRFFYLEDKEDN